MIDWENFAHALFITSIMVAILSAILHDWRVIPPFFAGVISFTLCDIFLRNLQVGMFIAAIAAITAIIVTWLILQPRKAKEKQND